MYYIMNEKGEYVDRNAYKEVGAAEAMLAYLQANHPENTFRIVRLG